MMKGIFLNLATCLGGILIADATLATLSKLNNVSDEAEKMWNDWAKTILVDNDQEKNKDLIVARFNKKEDEFKNSCERDAWNLETHFCCALALLRHAKMDLSDVLSCNGYVKYGLQEYLGLCTLNATECRDKNMVVSIEDYNRRSGLSLYLINTGKFFAKMKDEKDPKVGSRVTTTLTKLIIWYAYSARKEGKDFEEIAGEKDDIFDKAVIAFENGTSTKKRDYNLRSRSPKVDEDRTISNGFTVSKNLKPGRDVIEIHSSSSDSATEILPERPHKNGSTQSMWRSVPRNQYEIKYYSSYFDDKYRHGDL